jgi:hypothetical protein
MRPRFDFPKKRHPSTPRRETAHMHSLNVDTHWLAAVVRPAHIGQKPIARLTVYVWRTRTLLNPGGFPMPAAAAKREEVSRGLAAGDTFRAIAKGLDVGVTRDDLSKPFRTGSWSAKEGAHRTSSLEASDSALAARNRPWYRRRRDHGCSLHPPETGRSGGSGQSRANGREIWSRALEVPTSQRWSNGDRGSLSW